VVQQQLDHFEIRVVRRANERGGASRMDRAAHVRRLEEQLHVRVGAPLEQQLDDRQAGVLVRRVDGVPATVDPVAQLHRRIERRLSEDVPLADVGASVDQLPGQVPVGVHDRHEQR
jgi:hypothetical protein